MWSRRIALSVLVCGACLALAPSALAAKPVFHPRVKNALGLFPQVTVKNGRLQPAVTVPSQPLTPLTYHGGKTMTGGVTVHTIFWTGGTNPFQRRPRGAPHNYIGMIQQYLTDVAAASTGTSGGTCTKRSCNVFTVEPQYGFGLSPGHITHGDYSVHYSAASNSIVDTHAYPPKSQQCASPNDTAVCITDAQVQAEIDRVITATHGQRGLHNIWFVFTPPGVDECITPGVCESNIFGGYHSLSMVGHGLTIYGYIGDPIISSGSVNNPGNDPEGYPDAEVVILIVSHETNEAMTDPEGVGYMDPNGFETGDKCEVGPQIGTPLGFAGPDHAPYNQVVNGHKYLIQEMWANRDNSNLPNCVQATTNTSSPLPLPQVHLTQFSSTVSGNTENNASGVTVRVTLQREGAVGPVTVATGSSTTKAGAWSVSLGNHAVGDDRDVITVTYSGPGAPTPRSEQILTGNGGNPFTESGWTGFVAMDHGSFLTNTQTLQGIPPSSLTLEPCFQTGVEAFSINGVPSSLSPTEFCNTASDAATAPLSSAVGKGQAVAWSSLDNRAFTPPTDPNPNLTGALINLRVPVGEADSVSSFSNPFVPIPPGGFPSCAGDLEAQTVTCSGLVPGETYTVKDASKSASGKADPTGTVSVALAIKRGDTVSLSNGSRTLTTLHVANLRAVIGDHSGTLSGGQCQPGQYYGPPVSSPPTSTSAGSIAGGAALTGVICPLNGNAAGLPSASIMQTDEFSGGQTQTEVPRVVQITPTNGAIVQGSFVARAAPKLRGTVVPGTIALTVSLSGKTVFTSNNVNTKNGVQVSGLKPGFYQATWTLTDTNGDVRTRVTRFSVQ